ncbi:hypothetical protein AOL_s00043g543 [Orbilia oligospora ATCC 24927]|uniref:Uncharacterized protein n=2 Tax=Orbilia oligospora TaxID=2813651 RepID=G1X4B9_ARTOA|nr:hypothetical protein AOL_s00043g543 [Orbilia oligospora ATCC 24927]EGX52153.1 hypothetical protein AOL_s00043g543 [Orbilia oligospora ATCC 24927]KAF3289649.1 hypothetical protein TWF970_003417 [Orbilia oligospora]
MSVRSCSTPADPKSRPLQQSTEVGFLQLPYFCDNHIYHGLCPVSEDCLDDDEQLIASFENAKNRLYKIQSTLKCISILIFFLSVGCGAGPTLFSKGSREWQLFQCFIIVGCWVGIFAVTISVYDWAHIVARCEKRKLHGIDVWKKRNILSESAWWDFVAVAFLTAWSAGFVLGGWSSM